jgi:hypothetical protein
MKILGPEGRWLHPAEQYAIAGDLQLVGAEELASYGVLAPTGPNRVQWLGITIYVATDLGLFVYERTPGFDSPGLGPDDMPMKPWTTSGAFTYWQDVRGLELRSGIAWAEGRQEHLSSQTLHLDRPSVDLLRPESRQPRADWEEFFDTVTKAIATARSSQRPIE